MVFVIASRRRLVNSATGFFRSPWCLSAILSCSMGSGQLLAQTVSQVYGSEMEKQTMTASVSANAFVGNYQSAIVDSNTTKTTPEYAVGIYAGELRQLGVEISSSATDLAFNNGESRLGLANRTLKLKPRFGWVTPILAAAMTDFKAAKESVVITDMVATSTGGGLGVSIPFWNRAVVGGEVVYYRQANAADVSARKVEQGKRMDADFGASVDLTGRQLDLIFGYRVHKSSVIVEEVAYDEVFHGAYTGLRAGVYF